jgi:cation diffusion facilitator family transporter
MECNSLDAAYRRDVRRVTLGGMAANLGLFVLKLAGGILASSLAVVADAVHTLCDTSTDVAILIGVRYWTKPPDAEHPHGHRRIETVITIGIALVIAGVSVGLITYAIETLRAGGMPQPGWLAFAAALISIVVKEALYRWTRRVGARIDSSAVLANAWHHRSDALSSAPAAVAVALAALHPQWSFLDPVGALIVSLFIIVAAWGIARPALGQLIDTGAPEPDRDRIRTIALDTTHVLHVEAIRTRYVGPGLQVDLHVQVDGSMSVRDGHDVAGHVKHRLLEEGPGVVDVVVHLEPYEGTEDAGGGTS